MSVCVCTEMQRIYCNENEKCKHVTSAAYVNLELCQ